MRKLFFLPIVFMAMSACNDSQNKAEQPNGNVPDSTEYKVQIPEAGCYLYASGKDTLALKMEVFPNVVTGVLQYDFFGKDGSVGELDGKLHGDTLVADYSFMAEGMHSMRQVMFLIKNDIAVEGYGDMEEKDGKMVFKVPGQVDFSKGMPLRKISCQDYDPAQRLAQTRAQFKGVSPDAKPAAGNSARRILY